MKIIHSRHAFESLRRMVAHDVEEFWIIGLQSNKQVTQIRCLFRGTVDACLVHPRDIFRFACLTNSSSLIVAHNHPNQDANPSTSDLTFTRELVALARLMQIPVLDHIILIKKGYKSLADEGLVEFYREPVD